MKDFGSMRKNPLFGYGFALVLFGLSLSLRIWIGDHLIGYPFVTFLPAIVLTAVVAGAGPGALIGGLSVLSAVYFFMAPVNSFMLARQSDGIAVGFFLFIVFSILALTDRLHQKIDALDVANLERQRLVDYQKVLFAELQHRVANNLAFVSGLLSLQKRELEPDSPAAKSLDLAGLRVMAMSRIHRTLHDEASLNQPLTQFLHQLTIDLVKSAGAENAMIDVYGDDVRLDLDRLTTLALLISELVTNCAKHVLLKGLGNKISIHVERLDDRRLRIEVADNGPGVPAAKNETTSPEKLGQTIIRGLVKQLAGEYEVVNSQGTAAIITFPSTAPKA